MSRTRIVMLAVLCGAYTMPVYGQSQTPKGSGEVATTDATPEQFREYLKLSGIGEAWRATWIAAVDQHRSIGEPYWPESFWTDIKDEMRKTDLGPIAWDVYRSSISGEMMRSVNLSLQTLSVVEFVQTPLGQKFCSLWQVREQEGVSVLQAMTESTLERVYERDKPAIKAARARYLAEHPDWKD